MGSWEDSYRGFGIVYHALIEGHSSLAKELVRLNYASWAESVPPGINLVQAALLGGDNALAEELVNAGLSWSVDAKLLDIFNIYLPMLPSMSDYDFKLDNQLEPFFNQTLTITPMMNAAIYGNEQAANYLIKHQSANWRELDSFMNALLIFCKMANDLSNAGSDTDLATTEASTGTFELDDWCIASTLCLFGHVALWQKLNFADLVSEIPEDHLNLISLGLFTRNKLESLHKLAQDTPIKQLERENADLMEIAIERHNLKLVRWLVDEGFSDWNHVYKEEAPGYRIFHFAIENGFEELCDWLVAHNHNHWSDLTEPNYFDLEGLNALTLAIRGRQFTLARKLISQGHFDGTTPNRNETPFYKALEYGDTNFIQWMVESGFGQWTTTFEPYQNSILHVMANNYNLEPIQAVAKLSGIAWGIRNNYNATILLLAFSNQRRDETYYKHIVEIAKQDPETIISVAATEPAHSPLSLCFKNDLTQLFEKLAQILNTHHLKIPNDLINEILLHPHVEYTQRLLDYNLAELQSLERLDGYINQPINPANQALLRAEYAIRSADYTTQGLHIKAEQFMFDALSKPLINYPRAMEQFLLTLPARIHPAFALRVAPRLDACLAQVAWDTSRLSHPAIRGSIKHIIQEFSSEGCFYLVDKAKPVLFSYQKPHLIKADDRLTSKSTSACQALP